MSRAFEFAQIVAKYNPQSAELQSKILPIYLSKSKPPAQYLCDDRQIVARN